MARSLAALLASAATLAWSTGAGASPLGDPTVDRAVFGGATGATADALLVNPAALGLGRRGLELFAAGALHAAAVAVQRRAQAPDGSFTAGADVDATLLAPGGALGLQYGNGQFSVGVQASLPPSEETMDAGDATAYHARGGRHRERQWLVLGGSLRWGRFTVGASLRIVQTLLRLRFARDTALDAGRADVEGTGCGGAPCGFENPDARELYRVDTATSPLPGSDTIAVSFGVTAQLAERWWAGAAYHVPLGSLSAVRTGGDAWVTRAPRDGGEVVTGSADVRFTLPHRLRAGVRGRLGAGLDVVGELRWELLAALQRYDVRLFGRELTAAGVPEVYARPRGLRDQVALQVGVEQPDAGQRWRLGARVGVERGAVADARLSPLNPYPPAATLDLGAQLRVSAAWTVAVGYGVAWAPSQDTGAGAYAPLDRLACVDSGYDLDEPACATVRAGYGLPGAAGQYGRVDHAARLTLRWAVP